MADPVIPAVVPAGDPAAPAPAAAAPDPVAALRAEFQAGLAAQQSEFRENMRQLIGAVSAGEPAASAAGAVSDEQLRATYFQLQASADPVHQLLVKSIEHTDQLSNTVRALRADNQRLAQAQQLGVAGVDLTEAEKYTKLGTPLELALRLVKQDRETGAVGPGGAAVGGGQPPPAGQGRPLPNPTAAAAGASPAPGGWPAGGAAPGPAGTGPGSTTDQAIDKVLDEGGTLRTSVWKQLVGETDWRGAPTPRALKALEGQNTHKVKLVTG